MARNITIRFTGGPQNGAILYYPYTRDIDGILARYTKALVGHYEVVRKSDSGFVIDVRWNDGSTGKALPVEMPSAEAWLQGIRDPKALADRLRVIANMIDTFETEITSGGFVATLFDDASQAPYAHGLSIKSDIVLFFNGSPRNG